MLWLLVVWCPAVVAGWEVFRGEYGRSLGDHWQFGYDMGSRYGELIRLRFAAMPSGGQPIFEEAFYEARYPSYVAELRGIAAGSGLSYEEVVRLNTEVETKRSCSDYTAPPAVGHNEDNRASEKNRTFLAEVTIDGAFFAGYTYAGELPTAGFGWNAYVAFTTDWVCPKVLLETGVGRIFVARDMLTARSLDEALAKARTPHVAGHNYQIFNGTHFYVGEVARNVSVFKRVTEPIFKANEYDFLHWIPQIIGESTVHRTARAYAQLKTPRDASGVLDVLFDDRDVDNSGRLGIYCPHCTLCTVLFDKMTVSIFVDKHLVYAREDWSKSSSSSSSSQYHAPSSSVVQTASTASTVSTVSPPPPKKKTPPTRFDVSSQQQGPLHVPPKIASLFEHHISMWWFVLGWFLFCFLLILVGRYWLQRPRSPEATSMNE